MAKQGKRFKWHQLCCFISKTVSGKSEGENDEDKNPNTSKPTISVAGPNSYILGSSGPVGISSTPSWSSAKGIEISCADSNGAFHYWNHRQCGNVRTLSYPLGTGNQWSQRCLDDSDIIMLHNGVGYVCVGDDRILRIDKKVPADDPIQIEASRLMQGSKADNRLFQIRDCIENEHPAECHSYFRLLHFKSNCFVRVEEENLVCRESGSGVIINDAPIQNTTFDERDCSNSH